MSMPVCGQAFAPPRWLLSAAPVLAEGENPCKVEKVANSHFSTL